MEPITRNEMYLATAAGHTDVDLPEPVSREDVYLQKICERLKNVGSPSSEDIQAAVNAYLDEHGTTEIATMAEFFGGA